MRDWDLIEELGGEEAAEALMGAFYDRLFEDVMIGYFFTGKDKEALAQSQLAYLRANLGGRKGAYVGLSIRKAHAKMAILPGHFDRRHQILRELLEEFGVVEHVKRAWWELDERMRPMVLRQGGEAWAEAVEAQRRRDEGSS